MKIPLTKYGLPQLVVFPAMLIAAMFVVALGTIALLPAWAVILVEAILAAILVWVLMFFRDPERRCPSDANLLLAPADGRITDIEQVRQVDFIEGPALRIGIFLSIFNVHINRAPCNVKVERITYKKGGFMNAMNSQSGRVNESNNLGMIRTDSPRDRLLVRQISGTIARRIVCAAAEGRELTGGQRFGMIKFGSRTELYLPISPCVLRIAHCENEPTEDTQFAIRNTQYEIKCLVKIGDKVQSGLTPLIKYVERDAKNAETKD
ncbi:MAG: phosphatidylserine decarboxylase family protein [Phycisphaerales bacterium]|nr:MAG: phosphatidylserine decarboxylase family protein [Phycisphaerales bacterium]